MTPQLLEEIAIGPALALLPARMDSRMARVMLVTICLQESALKYRQQVLRRGRHWWEWRGPARGWPQFESTGLRGVLTHHASRGHAEALMRQMGYESPSEMMPAWLSSLHAALKHNDVLALGMARLLLWTLPQALPAEAEGGMTQYLEAWRPGAWARGSFEVRRGLRRKWINNWQLAEDAVVGGGEL